MDYTKKAEEILTEAESCWDRDGMPEYPEQESFKKSVAKALEEAHQAGEVAGAERIVGAVKKRHEDFYKKDPSVDVNCSNAVHVSAQEELKAIKESHNS